MTKKDIATAENTDRQEKGGSLPVEQPKQSSTEEDPNPQIKNAHATGDGSYGRNREEEVEEKDKGEDKKESY